ncbi:transmembrane exosortase EpsH [endosymbiont of Riftia pachyptila (vent Ph05)]|jgi:EpsI family protein|uniref:Transmembrane exosortase n=2 Tax=sulfur-oxidizing symbionts TaxID=32036 RepID=G2FHH9_9GAMM|nr:transmembrane exosortase EpsH [endosymbiont of Riftia pachyptila (vent Ph05)]EGW53739.1 transmembrane exosortase [endosymbiont of Tevnia jerichonana (vent Tica)]
MTSNNLAETGARFFWNGQALLLVSALLVPFVAYYPSLERLVELWSDKGSVLSHGFLLFPISLYLFYQALRQTAPGLRIQPSLLGISFLLGATLLWLLAGLVYIESVQQAAFVLVLLGVVVSLLGVRQALPFFFPILLLLSVVPVWQVLTPYLQTASAIVSAQLLDVTGFTTVREGYLILIPDGVFEVEEGCSGLKYQLTAVTIAFLYAKVNGFNLRQMLIYAVIASGMAFLANIVRIYSVVAIGYFTGMQNPVVQDHDTLGWVVFALFIFVLLVYLGRLFPPQAEKKAVDPEADAPVALTRWPVLGGVVLVSMLGPLLALAYSVSAETADSLRWRLPEQVGDWQLQARRLTQWQPKWQQGDLVLQGRYLSHQDSVDLFITHFEKQAQDKEAVHVDNKIFSGERWARVSRQQRQVVLADGSHLPVEASLIKGGGQASQRLVWRWYGTAGHRVASGSRAKLWNLYGTLTGSPAISVVLVSTPVTSEQQDAEAVLMAFLSQFVTDVETALSR